MYIEYPVAAVGMNGGSQNANGGVSDQAVKSQEIGRFGEQPVSRRRGGAARCAGILRLRAEATDATHHMNVGYAGSIELSSRHRSSCRCLSKFLYVVCFLRA